MTRFKKSGGRCSFSAVVSAPSLRLQGRGRSPSGPKIQAQRAVKPKSKTQNPPSKIFLPSHFKLLTSYFILSCPAVVAQREGGPPQRLRHQSKISNLSDSAACIPLPA
jgi:hypothetical protein